MAHKVKTLLGLWFVLLSAATINVELVPALSAAPIAAQTMAQTASTTPTSRGEVGDRSLRRCRPGETADESHRFAAPEP